MAFAGTAGEARTITVQTTADAKVEANETLSVSLGSAQPLGAGVAAASLSTSGSPATGTVTNDDSATLSISGATVTEGGSLVFTVTLSAAVQGGLSVSYSTADGTAQVADSDYAAASGTLVFTGAAGEQRTITVQTTADAKVEADETLSVALGSAQPLGAGVSASSLSVQGGPATGTVGNDDSATLSITGATVTEGGSLVFTVTLSAAVQG